MISQCGAERVFLKEEEEGVEGQRDDQAKSNVNQCSFPCSAAAAVPR